MGGTEQAFFKEDIQMANSYVKTQHELLGKHKLKPQ